MQKRLSLKQERLILDLKQTGQTQAAIAAIVSCSQPQVSRVLAELQDTRPLGRQILYNAADQLARAAINHAKDDPEACLELMDRIDLAQKRDKAASSATTVNVNLAGFYGVSGST